jgi:starch-binding outer membrane protein, SusD/RagB family
MRTINIAPADREDIMKRQEQRPPRPKRRGSGAGGLLAALALAAVAAGCEGILNVEAPGVVDADDMLNPAAAPVIVSGAISDFECALGAYIVNQAVLGNELRDASVTAGRFPLDQRIIHEASPYGVNSCTGNPPGIYGPLATARWSADNALALLDSWSDAEVPNRTQLIGQAAAFSGYSLVLLGEGFCSAVIEDLGPEVEPSVTFVAAVARFDRAIELGDAATRNLALLGRARAHLNLGNGPAAVADAEALLQNAPAFVRVAGTSTASSRRWNRLGDEFFGGRVTVDPLYRDLEVDGVPDPRTESFDTGTLGHDSATPVWLAAKVGPARAIALRTGPVPVASWREAHLIIAEVEGGQDAENHINVLRNHWGLPTFDSSGMTEAEILEQVIEERARELFLEGHHLNDLRRFNLAQVPAPGSSYRQGGLYGDVRCFPLPAVERNNNPNVN